MGIDEDLDKEGEKKWMMSCTMALNNGLACLGTPGFLILERYLCWNIPVY
jgi:hypothetical protein